MPLDDRTRDLIESAVGWALSHGANPDEVRAEVEYAIETYGN
jgi:hypothetical protein